MRVLQIVADGRPGGGTTHVLQVLRGLRDSFSMGLVTQRDSYLFNETVALDLPVFGVDFFRGRLDVRVPFELRRIVREIEPDLTHAHGGRAAFFYSLVSGKAPYVYTVHGYHFVHKGTIMRRLALSAERVACRSAKEVILVSEHDARLAKFHGAIGKRTRTTVIHNGIPLKEAKTQRRGDLYHIGFIGRLEPQKDPILFLQVMERLPEYTAAIVGDGSMSGEVRSEVERCGLSGRVEMLGMLTHRETLDLLPSLGAVVMTSRWEGLPILPLEAMRASVPVVAPDVYGLGEVIEDGESGLLVDGRSPDDLARAARWVLEDASLRERVVCGGRERVRSAFSEDGMLARIREVYQRVVTP